MKTIQLLKNAGHNELLSIQSSTIETFRDNSNVTLIAQTGSGKTLSFLLATGQFLHKRKGAVQLLILAPTRELSLQIAEVFKSMQTGLKATVCYGGHSVKDEQNSLRETPSVVIGTPGRILDHLQRKTLILDECELIVIDEFDKCLEYGFEKDMNEIRTFLPQEIGSIYVSATNIHYTPTPWRRTKERVLDFSTEQSLDNLKEWYVKSSDTYDTLFDCLTSFGNEKSVIFCNYREVVDDVTGRLKDDSQFCESYHGGMNQSDRERALIKFTNNSINTLICTDLGARGLDIEDVKHVVHFQFPSSEETFIHRKGRTARAGEEGNSYIIFKEDQTLPGYVTLPEKEFKPKPNKKPSVPDWITLYFNEGKKQKIRKLDLVGFLSKQFHLKQDEIGKIDLLDHMAYVAIHAKTWKTIHKRLGKSNIKGKSIFIKKAK